MNGLLQVMDDGLVSACHDISEGGLAICISEMAMGNKIGAVIDLSKIPGSGREDVLLFSETLTRWIVSIPQKHQKQFEKILNQFTTPFSLIGRTKKGNVSFEQNGKMTIDESIPLLYHHWTKGIASLMG